MMNETLIIKPVCVPLEVLSEVVLIRDAVIAAGLSFVVGTAFGLVMAYTIPKLVRWYFAPAQRT
jgi:hypothetical protein